ncbi:MAG: hypothetical protein VX583_03170 [Bdellovibrionota bacterium]
METIFKKHFVAYLDLLGFKEFVFSKNFQENIQRTLEIIENSVSRSVERNPHGIYPNETIKTTVISDSIILSIPFDETETWQEQVKSLRFLLSAVEKIQYTFALNNIWVRGAVSAGLLNHNKKNVIGKALINAYLLEQQSVFPRVLVDPKTLTRLFKSTPNCNTKAQIINEVNRDFGNPDYSGKFLFNWSSNDSYNVFSEDYPFFIHYLNSLLLEDESDTRSKILDNLIKNLYVKDPKIHKKFRWVTDYLKVYISKNLDGKEYLNNYYQKLSLL